jgi:hypothetical protein
VAKKTLLIACAVSGVCLALFGVWWFFFAGVNSKEALATINSQLTAANNQPTPSTHNSATAPLGGNSTVISYAGKTPDRAFWSELRPLFSDTILGGGHFGSEVFNDFYNNQSMYIFTPGEYDESTKTITVTWRSKNPEPSEEGCTNCQFLGSHAVAIDVNNPENGIVAHLSSSVESPSIELLSKGMASVDTNSVNAHNFSSLPPALAKWATALIQASQHPVGVEVTVME